MCIQLFSFQISVVGQDLYPAVTTGAARLSRFRVSLLAVLVYRSLFQFASFHLNFQNRRKCPTIFLYYYLGRLPTLPIKKHCGPI